MDTSADSKESAGAASTSATADSKKSAGAEVDASILRMVIVETETENKYVVNCIHRCMDACNGCNGATHNIGNS